MIIPKKENQPRYVVPKSNYSLYKPFRDGNSINFWSSFSAECSPWAVRKEDLLLLTKSLNCTSEESLIFPPQTDEKVILEEKNDSKCCETPNIVYHCDNCETNHIKREMRPRKFPLARLEVKFCRFCQKNGEPEEMVRSHSLRTPTGIVSCPILREYNCPICHNGGGDEAHTITYCPLRAK